MEDLKSAVIALMSLPPDPELSYMQPGPREIARRDVEDLLELMGLSFQGQMAMFDSIMDRIAEERERSA